MRRLIVKPRARLLVFSKMSFALFVCTNKLLCSVYSVQCVRDRLMTEQAKAVVKMILLHDASKEHSAV